MFDLYEYIDGNANLSFRFTKDKDIRENKEKFLSLLKKAVSDLEKELNIQE